MIGAGLSSILRATLPPVLSTDWSYERAFCRNLGLVDEAEQERLRTSRVAIAGLGGVGGVHLATLARLGIGRFSIADPDSFDTVNTNRQYGALRSTAGRPKADVMAEIARDINPDVDLRVTRGVVQEESLGSFLEGADLVVDGLDAFEIDARRTLFRRAARLGIPAVTAGPVGFSVAWLVFRPGGMAFDRYFDLRDEQSDLWKFCGFIVGLVPRATHRGYVDLSRVDAEARSAPCAGASCQLAAGVAATEAVKLLLGRGPVRPAPWFHQFDAYTLRLVRGRLRWGNRSPLQRLKRAYLARILGRRGRP